MVPAIALSTVVVVIEPTVPFLIAPELKEDCIFTSFASGHPSPSESKSKLLGIPSLSVSK